MDGCFIDVPVGTRMPKALFSNVCPGFARKMSDLFSHFSVCFFFGKLPVRVFFIYVVLFHSAFDVNPMSVTHQGNCIAIMPIIPISQTTLHNEEGVPRAKETCFPAGPKTGILHQVLQSWRTNL